ncbi:hypothetical protein DFJ73DRAFT_801336 [Zopfochytrium polystomum]|nr:hypothetical protein DFJ73DRAFT_801336 [Zopfochytrium polystomum]
MVLSSAHLPRLLLLLVAALAASAFLLALLTFPTFSSSPSNSSSRNSKSKSPYYVDHPPSAPSSSSSSPFLSNVRVAILTVAMGDQWNNRVAIDNHRAYANKHGYDVVVMDDASTDLPPQLGVGKQGGKRPHPVWAKVIGLRRHIYEYDWIWLLDADAFIANDTIKVEDYVAAVQSLHLDRNSNSNNDSNWTSSTNNATNYNDHPEARTNPAGPPPPLVFDWPEPPPDGNGGDRVGPDIIVAIDCNYVNAGSLLIRGARGAGPWVPTVRGRPPPAGAPVDPRPWVVQLADYWLATEPTPDAHTDLMEQHVLRLLIDANVLDSRRRVAAVPLRLMNSYAPAHAHDCQFERDPYPRHYLPGDWVIHFVYNAKPTMRDELIKMGLMRP